jgi:Kef-type K+ transport system membrane component KefB
METVQAVAEIAPGDVAFTLFSLAAILAVARFGGLLAARCGQPRVVGEVVAGILLGPSLLGERVSHALFPAEGRPFLAVLSEVGVVLFVFLVGLELDFSCFAPKLRIVASITIAEKLVPFAAGVALALGVFAASGREDPAAFTLFMGVACSTTAFPVLARIVAERGFLERPLGLLTMTLAAIDDVLSWIVLAFVAAIAGPGSSWLPVQRAVAAAVFFVVMVRLARPLLLRRVDAAVDQMVLPAAVAAVFLAAFTTAAIGLHEIFGAFVLGAIVPRGRLQRELHGALQPVVGLFLPVFLVVTGLGVNLRDLPASAVWQLPLVLFAASVGKIAGAALGARSQGLGTRESVGLGVLMNTRGLTELIVLDAGRRLGVIDAEMYALLVVMAVVTTAATVPLLRIVSPDPDLAAGQPARRRLLRLRERFAD